MEKANQLIGEGYHFDTTYLVGASEWTGNFSDFKRGMERSFVPYHIANYLIDQATDNKVSFLGQYQ